MVRLCRLAWIAALVLPLLVTSSAWADFGIVPGSFTTSVSTTQAGAHPDFTTNFAFNTTVSAHGQTVPAEPLKDVAVDLPPGLIGDPNGTPKCPNALFDHGAGGQCPTATQVGTVT